MQFFTPGHTILTVRRTDSLVVLRIAYTCIRTDFDAFSDLEIRTLMYHGYSLVNHRLINYCREVLEQDYPGIGTLVRTKAPTAPDRKTSLNWQDLSKQLQSLNLPDLDDWATFNQKLTNDHGKILKDRRSTGFENIHDFSDPASKKTIEQAVTYLRRSNSSIGPIANSTSTE
jgi:hypothetical protein